MDETNKPEDVVKSRFASIIAPLTMPKWQLDRLVAVDTWKAEIRVITNLGQEWVEGMVEQFSSAAATTTMPNWAFISECMARVKAMISRGDTDYQIAEWVDNLPNELLRTLEREELALRYLGIYQAGYPGGPGALFKDEKG